MIHHRLDRNYLVSYMTVSASSVSWAGSFLAVSREVRGKVYEKVSPTVLLLVRLLMKVYEFSLVNFSNLRLKTLPPILVSPFTYTPR